MRLQLTALDKLAADRLVGMAVMGGSLYFVAHPGNGQPCSELLTRRQLEVLRLLARGKASEEIASSLVISIHTVRRHVQDILARLKVHSKAEAVSRAFSDRLI